MTLYLTDNTERRRDRAGEGVGLRPRGQVLPGRRDDELGFRRHRARARLPGARGDGDARRRAVAARRSHRRRRRHLRSRARLRRALARGDRARLSRRSGSCSSTSRPRRRPRSSPPRRRDVAATITPQHLLYSRNALFAGGIRPHLYCLPDPEARDASPARSSRRRPSRQPEVLPRHRFRAARAAHEGERLRLRRLLLGARRARAVRRGVRGRRRARPARGLREPLRRGFLRAAAQRRQSDARRASRGPCRPNIRSASDAVVPLRAGETVLWRVGRRCRPVPAPGAGNLAARCYPSVRSQPDRRRPVQPGGGKSGLRRAGCRVTPGRNKSPLARMTKARNRATETSRRGSNRPGG